MKAERQLREQRGRDAEDHVAAYLEAEGYTVLARRLHTPAGEIDLVAFQDSVLAFIEIKARKFIGRGLYSLSERQAARIAGAAEFFLAEHPEHAEHHGTAGPDRHRPRPRARTLPERLAGGRLTPTAQDGGHASAYAEQTPIWMHSSSAT